MSGQFVTAQGNDFAERLAGMPFPEPAGQLTGKPLPGMGGNARIDTPIAKNPHLPLQERDKDQNSRLFAGPIEALLVKSPHRPVSYGVDHPTPPDERQPEPGDLAKKEPRRKIEQEYERYVRPDRDMVAPYGDGESNGACYQDGPENFPFEVPVALVHNHSGNLPTGPRLRGSNRQANLLPLPFGEKLRCLCAFHGFDLSPRWSPIT